MKDFKKGDSVYVYSDTQKDFNGIVVSVGSKYITILDGHRKWRFDKETHICEEWSVYTLFASKEDKNKYIERRENEQFVNCEIRFVMNKMSDEDFEIIYNIIKKYRNQSRLNQKNSI